MNDPRYDDHERRIQKLEQDRNDIVESEKLLLRLARLHRVSLQELKAQFEVEAGDVRQRFDNIERSQQDLKQDVSVVREDMDTVKGIVKQILDLLQNKQ